MNICFLGSINYPAQNPSLAFDGGVRRMLPLLQHIQKKGHRIIMVIPTMKSDDGYEEYDGFPIYHLGPPRWLRGNLYLSGILLALKVIRKLREVVKSHDVDIIHVFNPTLLCGIPGWLVARSSGNPMVLEFSDLVAHFGIETGRTSPMTILSRSGLLIQNSLPHHADMVIATNYIGKTLLSKGIPAERISVIPCGADSSVFHPQINGADIRAKYNLGDLPVILYQGLVCRAYGLDILIEAIARVSKEFGDFRLLIVGFHKSRGKKEFGEDEDIIHLKTRARQLGVEDKVIFTGPQPHDLIPKFIAAADICINPMPYTLTCRAGSPVKVFEYMAVGKPVVATMLESIEDVIIDGETGLLARAGAEELAEKILLLLKSPGLREKLGRNAREKVVAEFEWARLGDKLDEAYRQAMENHSRRKR